MNTKIKKISQYIYDNRNLFLFALSLGVISIIIQEVPFINLYLPYNTPLIVILVSIIILFNLFRIPKLFFALIFITIVLCVLQLSSQAEQVSNLIFVLLFILVISHVISFFKDIA
jgi:hypothetical protein